MMYKILNIILMSILCFILFVMGFILGYSIHNIQYTNHHQNKCHDTKSVETIDMDDLI